IDVSACAYVRISAIGTSALIVVIPAAGSIPCRRPRRALRSPLTAPTASSGTVTSSSMIGSSNTGSALWYASLKASEPAILNAISEESTACIIPSTSVTRTPYTGAPASSPCSIASRTPLSTAGRKPCEMTPPTILSTNSYVAASPSTPSIGSITISQSPNWPRPPVCFLYRCRARASLRIVSLYGTRGGCSSTSTWERPRTRLHAHVELHPPRVPYKETIRKEARARHRYKKQTGGRGQFGDCEIVIEPIEAVDGEAATYEFVDKIVGGVISQGFRPAVDKGVREAMEHGELAGAPVYGVRVTLVDGMMHAVDSSEMAFKIAGSLAFKEAYHKADPVLLEPIMELEVTVPDDAVGAVNGDLNARRGRLHGMEPAAGMTTIKAEVPMAEILTYAQALTSMTGGRGDYHMSFVRYDEVPAHVAQKIIDETKQEREAARA